MPTTDFTDDESERDAPRPLLRGWSHAVGAVLAVIGTIALGINAHGDRLKLVTALVYGCSLIALLTFSALYHIPPWRPKTRALMRRIDHANIFIMIAGTYTPVAAILLRGTWRIAVLCTVWGIGITGIALAMPAIRSRRWVVVGIYIGMGWIGIFLFPQVFGSTGAAGLLLVLGGVLYSVGAAAYATKWPKLWPGIFGYHEVFHLFVIAASVSFYIFITGIVATHPSQ